MEIVYPYIPLILIICVPAICFGIYSIVDRICTMLERKYMYYGKKEKK